LKLRQIRDVAEIPISRQHDQTVADAKLGNQRINGSDLNAAAAALVGPFGRFDLVVTRWDNHR